MTPDTILCGGGLLLDLSRTKWKEMPSHPDFRNMADLARNRFHQMAQGEKVNVSENRAVHHLHARSGADPFLVRERDRIREFSIAIREENRFKNGIVIGIGGSRLGPEALVHQLSSRYRARMSIDFVSSVDQDAFDRVTRTLAPSETLFIVISKSFATRETRLVMERAENWLKRAGVSPSAHMVAITTPQRQESLKGKFLDTFFMTDEIGGRFSVSSAVGALPVSLAFGADLFDRFLAGCRHMDRHVLQAPLSLPMASALLEYRQHTAEGHAITHSVTYGTALNCYPEHLRQLWMESLGKHLCEDGSPLPFCGPLHITGNGPEAQHTYFQMLHQGRRVPTEFVLALPERNASPDFLHDGVTGTEELWANALAQADALSEGNVADSPVTAILGQTPCSLLVLPDLSPESAGALYAFHEHKVVLLGFLLGLNPFDQFGVEAGKQMANAYRNLFRTYRKEGKEIPVLETYRKRLESEQPTAFT